MNRWTLNTAILLLSLSNTASSALYERLGGLAYYDDVANLTWLSDANYASTSGYDTNGNGMLWGEANTWANNLNINGVSGWRLPSTPDSDPTCSHVRSGENYGYNCTGSELGNLFYNVLGGVAGESLTTTHSSNYDLFTNISWYSYWSSTEYSSTQAWDFYFHVGYQNFQTEKDNANFLAWAVHDGDVSSVPVPAAFWLFVSGAIGLVYFTKRNQPMKNT